MHFVIALAMHGCDRLGLPIVVVEARSSGHNMDVYSKRFHVGEALLWGPNRPGSNANAARFDTMGLPYARKLIRRIVLWMIAEVPLPDSWASAAYYAAE